MNFWGSWCEPCVEEMPDLQRVHESLGDDVAFVGVNVNDDAEAALQMAERTGVTYDLARDVEGELVREPRRRRTSRRRCWSSPTAPSSTPSTRQISAERLCEKINQSLSAGRSGVR